MQPTIWIDHLVKQLPRDEEGWTVRVIDPLHDGEPPTIVEEWYTNHHLHTKTFTNPALFHEHVLLAYPDNTARHKQARAIREIIFNETLED